MGDIFLKLLNMSITACWLILAVLCVRVLFRRIPKWVNCLLWGVVAIRLVFPFSIESVFSLQPSAQPIQSSTVVGGEVLPYVPSVDSDLAFVENTVNPMLAETFAYQASESAAPLQVVTGIAGFVWICGMGILLVFALGSMLRLYLQVREAVRYQDNIFICDAVKSPFILGVIRPRVYLASSLCEDSASGGREMECIIAHEKAHLKRKDHLWKPFGYLLLCVYWFNPLCWAAYACLCRDIELACDEKVIRDMSFADKKEYSQVLLSCAAKRQLVFACPLAFGEVGVKERVKTVLNYKKPAFWMTLTAIAVCAVLAVCFLTNPAEESAKPDNSFYGSTVAGLGDNETYAFLAMDYDYHVMAATDLIYDAGAEPQAAVYCDVYYYVDGEVLKLGTVMSEGTAYPITFTRDGIYAASGHSIEKYVISEESILSLEKGVYEQFDEAGNAQYTSVKDGQESEAAEEEYLELRSEYGRSQIVHFSYGAEGSVNEYQENEEALAGQEAEADSGEVQKEYQENGETLAGQEPDADSGEVQRELERVVSSVGLENAYPWNNTVDFKEDADMLIKMASDETGRFEIYGIMSAKYGTYGLLLNDWLDGEQNWNFAYVPWVYSGAPSDEPILEPDGKGKYVFAYVYKYDDVPWWKECILDCGYDTGHMELLSQDGVPVASGIANDELPDEEAFVVTNIFTKESKPLLAEAGRSLSDILESDFWNTEGTSDCASNIEILINGATYKYHSDCGTFNDNVNQRSLSLDEKTKHLVNSLLAEYISLTAMDVPVE